MPGSLTPSPPPPFPPFRPHRSERHELFSDLSLPLPVSISAVQVTLTSIRSLLLALCFAVTAAVERHVTCVSNGRAAPRAWRPRPSCRRLWRSTTAFAPSSKQSSSQKATSECALQQSCPHCAFSLPALLFLCRWFCSACKMHTPAIKCQFVTHMPAVLCVHLKRFAWIGHLPFKPPVHVHAISVRAA